jgi:hypothetical protein
MPLLLYEVIAWTSAPFNLQPEEHAETRWFTIDEAGSARVSPPGLRAAHAAWELP